MNITGYKQIKYNDLQDKMASTKEVSNMRLAFEIGVESPQTIKNALKKDGQLVSDKILTKVCEAIGVNAVVIWEKGVRNYYVKSK